MRLLVFALLWCCAASPHAVAAQAATAWRLVWADEFDRTGLPDSTRWSYDVGGSGWGNNELQFYTQATLTNARTENGHLIIEARRETRENRSYTSARLVSKHKGDWTYGRFETRARLPRGRGTWPAIWMLPTDWAYGGWPNSGEIDVMEHVGHQPGQVHASIHTRDRNHMKGTQATDTIQVPDAMDAFHVYAMEWTPTEIRAFVDDTLYFRYRNDGAGVGTWPFDKPFHWVLNIAVGGNWGGQQGVDDTVFPARMEIDYVRVYSRRGGGR